MSQSGPMIKPEQIDALPIFDAAQKARYKGALANLWNEYNKTALGSPQRTASEQKIKSASQQIMHHLSLAGKGSNGAGAASQRPAGQQQGQSTQPQANAQQAVRPQSQSQAPSQPQPQPQQNTSARTQSTAMSHLTPQQQQTIRDKAKQEIMGIAISPPPGHPAEQLEQYIRNFRERAYQALLSKKLVMANGEAVNRELAQYRQRNQQPPQEVVNALQTLKQQHAAYDKSWTEMLQQNQNNASKQAGQQPNKNPVQPPMQRPGTQQGVAPPPSGEQQDKSQVDNKLTNNQVPQNTQSPAQPQHNFPMNQNSPIVAATQNAPQFPQTQQPNTSQTMQQPTQQPQSTQQSQVPQSNFGVQNHPPQRPQINAQQAQNMRQQSSLHQTPNSAMPNSATQQNQQPHALSHQAAISQAAGEYTRQQQAAAQAAQQQSHGSQQMPNGAALNNPQHNTPTSAHPYPQNVAPAANKTQSWKIDKQMTMDARSLHPVPGPPSRPTLSGASMLHQPGIQRPPPYILEGEGDHVLSKRKLDELVRQVTGSALDANGHNKSVLDPDVEESILQVADDFVDNVITSACKLAKLRTNQTLDVRDVQLVLERNYGIRIPGYSLDEVRTVRKFNPAPGWQSKMQAIQAGKVMGSRDA